MSTDKGVPGHNYYMVYDRLITTPPKRVLEIGIWTGHSLQGWVDRWPEAEVHGFDISLDRYELDGPWHVHVGNAYDEALFSAEECVLDWASEGFDLIVDDGPHTIASQCFAAANWSRLLRPGGWFFIEDVPSMESARVIAENFYADERDRCFCIDLEGFSNDQYDSRIVATYRPAE